MLHLLRVGYRLREGFPPHEAEDALQMLAGWEPPAGVRIVRRFADDAARGGVMLFEMEQLMLLAHLIGTFDFYFDFQVAPATDEDHAAGASSTLTWDHRLAEGKLDLRMY